MRLNLPGKARPYLMAHRGNRVACPENTLAAFRRALADRADVLETDVRLSRDGAFVLIHDATVDRTTDGRGSVAELSVDQLKALSAGSGRKGFETERIPLLGELLAMVPAGVALALELKTDDFLFPGVVRRLCGQLQHFGLLGRTVVLSFSLQRLLSVRKSAPDLPIGWITWRNPLPQAGVELLGVFWPLLLANPCYPWLAHLRRQAVCPLDPTPDRRLPIYCALGCDAVLTDNPAQTRPLLDRWQRVWGGDRRPGAKD